MHKNMENHIAETLLKLASSIETLAETIEKDAEASQKHVKTASANRDFGFGGVSEVPDKGADPLLSFILS